MKVPPNRESPSGAEPAGKGSSPGDVAGIEPPAAKAPAAGHTGRRDVVVCSLEAWDQVWRRNQFLVRELLARDPALRVLFVEPAVDVLHGPSRRGHLSGRGLHRVPGYDRLWRLRPLKVVPRVAGPLADRLLVRTIQRAAARLGFNNPVAWINDATYATLLDSVPWPAVYDITDDWLLASLTPRQRARLRARDRRLLDEAAAVVVCSPALAASRRATAGLVVIGNGVDAEHFRTPRPRPPDLPAEPTAVYAGTLHEDRLDVGLCLELAAELPWLQLCLLGPNALTASSVAMLSARPNIHLLGPRPYSDVPAYLQHAGVIVVPHVVSPFTDSLDPIKAYECLAVDRPTVATPVAGFRELAGDVDVAERDLFPVAVRAALERGERGQARRAPPTWSQQAEQFDAVLQGAAGGGRRPLRAEPAHASADYGRPLRVAYVDHCARLSGAQLALLRLVGALDQVESHVVLAEEGPLTTDLAAAGAKVTVLPMKEGTRGLKKGDVGGGWGTAGAVLATVRYGIGLARHLQSVDADLVHTNSLKAAVYGGMAGRLAGVPVVWHLRDRVADDYLPRPAVAGIRLLSRCLPHAIIANSAATAATVSGDPNRRRVPVTVVYDPVPPGATRRTPPEPLCVGIVGRIAPWKGQDLFLRAFAAAFPSGTEQAVVVGAPLFGEDDFDADLRALVGDLGLAGRVEFRGFRKDVAGEMARLHVLVHASVIPEPFGLVVVEAMAAGLAVVAAGAGGPAEVLTPEVDGLLYPMGDRDALTAALVRLGEDPALRGRLGRAAAERAAEFAPALIAGHVVDVYRSVIERDRRRTGA
ncbi:MAG: glycosyltransferase [Actinobacteria bacterium]|nr:glycosyltransferase [Actinomycetota bacterium]